MSHVTVIDGSRTFHLTESDLARFWVKVEESDGCWHWVASIRPDGYGQFGLRSAGGSWTTAKAYRLSLALSGVDLKPGMEVDHVCHVRHCVNPAHLRLVTHAQNGANRASAQVNSKSGVRGVFWYRRAWVARATHGARTLTSYGHGTIESAEAAAISLRIELGIATAADRMRLSCIA